MKTLLTHAICIASLVVPVAAAPEAENTQSLDGEWKIAFDPDNSGREAGWTQKGIFSELENLQPIQVPSCWEEIETDYEGVAFYGTTFEVPAEWDSNAVRLQFNAVNFRAEVWLNNVAVGVHEGGFTPFEFRVDDLLKFGEENFLSLRVAGPILLQDKRIDGVGPMETTQWRGAITGGIWQSVRLVATGDVWVDDVFIESKIAHDTATLHVELDHGAAEIRAAEIEIAIHSAEDQSKVLAKHNTSLRLSAGTYRDSFTLKIPDAKHWSPDSPHLYLASVRVAANGTLSDTWTSRFGLREFTIRNKKFHLNGEPMFLKATFFEGLYPVKLAYPDSEQMARREIQLAKEAGFNMIRPWRKPPPPMWLDLCDEMGVLTVGSLAIECMDFPVESPNLPGWVENEVRESILRDRNRACVVQWELFNELKRPVLMRLLHPMAMLARELDPTRLILDESGGWAQGANMYLPYQSVATKFNDIHDYPGPQINDIVYEKLRLTGTKTHEQMKAMGLGGRMPGKNVVVGLMTFFSELGYGSLPDLEDNNRRFAESGNPIVPPTVYHKRIADEHRQALKESGFDEVFPTLKSFCLDQQQIHGTANRRMIEAVRCNPNVEGYCIHALTAGNWIIGAGMLDLFRNPKTYAYEGTKAANQPRIMSIRVRPRNVYAIRGTSIEINGVNELAPVDASLEVRVIDAKGESFFSETTKAPLAESVTELFRRRLDTARLSGTYKVQAILRDVAGKELTKNEHQFDVFGADQLVSPKARIAVLDLDNSLKPFLRERGIDFVESSKDTDHAIPVFVSRTVAKAPEQAKRHGELRQFIKSGGTAVYLGGGGPRVTWGAGSPASELLPFAAHSKPSIGLWNCISHVVKNHPVFAGLPTNCTMGAVYENVWPVITLKDFPGEVIAGSIGFDWFPDYDKSKRHYYGPGDTWWGADVGIAKVGKGLCVASQLRLVDNLGKDPVADRILFNMIRWVSSR
jgi:hypothetical protein